MERPVHELVFAPLLPFANIEKNNTKSFAGKAFGLKIRLALLFVTGILSAPFIALSQGVGTVENYNNTRTIPAFGPPASTTIEIVAETVNFGPATTWTVNGTLIIYSKNVWISPTATFTGTTGTIIFRNPTAKGGASSATLIDGNGGNFIDVNVQHDNASNMQLTNLTPPVMSPVWAGSGSGALKIGKEFQFVSATGDVILNGSDFIFDGDATIGGYKRATYVQTGNSIAGHMVKTFGSSQSFIFPVGFEASNTYNPARITASSGTFHVSVQDYSNSSSVETSLQASGYVNRTWHIFADAATAATVELQHEVGVQAGGFNGTNSHIITRWEGGSTWESHSASAGSPGTLTTGDVPAAGTLQNLSTTVVASGATSQAYWTKSSNPSLPVTLISFNAFKEGTVAQLTWKTSSETNSSSFEVQRSQNAKDWKAIGEVNAQGESTEEHSYSFTDSSPLANINYYRLKMIDIDGSYAMSTIKSINAEDNTTVSVYPNPVSDYLTINMQDWNNVTNVAILNTAGRAVYDSGNEPEGQIGVKQLRSGIYLVKIKKADDAVITKRIVINN